MGELFGSVIVSSYGRILKVSQKLLSYFSLFIIMKHTRGLGEKFSVSFIIELSLSLSCSLATHFMQSYVSAKALLAVSSFTFKLQL